MTKTTKTGIKSVGKASALTLNRKSKPGDGSFSCGRKGMIICI